jgi:hypothetical protein
MTRFCRLRSPSKQINNIVVAFLAASMFVLSLLGVLALVVYSNGSIRNGISARASVTTGNVSE